MRPFRCGNSKVLALLVLLGPLPAAAQQALPDEPGQLAIARVPAAAVESNPLLRQSEPSPQEPRQVYIAPPQRGEAAKGPPEVLNQAERDQSDDQLNPAVFRHHLIADRVWISGQANFIFQAHDPFHSPYEGPNSFRSRQGQTALSRVLTLFTGVRITRWGEFLLDVEEAGGKGLSEALGMAGYINLDVVRNPQLGQGVYLSRYMVHQTIPLTADRLETQPNPFYLESSIPRRRIEFRMGKMSMVDFFDVNSVGSDSHLQFTNWTIDNNGGYDYAADTRGYTIAAVLEYQGPKFGARYAEGLMPTVANGIDLDYALRRARASNLELEWRPHLWQGHATEIRPLAYLNRANMGDYRQAINAYLEGQDPTPNITLHRHQGTLKQGFGINIQQDLPANFRAFFRAGWNEGHHESFAYTEVNDTVAVGADLTGDAWGRNLDKIGTAIVSNGLSRDHRQYLALGGLGFILGDGRLNYGREFISESYYNLHAISGLYFALQLSFVDHPGYNRDRGPVVVPGVRAHVDF